MVSARGALRKLWLDACTVYEYQPVVKGNGGTVHEEAAVLVDEPCKLSFSRLAPVNQTDTAASVTQVVKLFLDETLEIKVGAKIVVNRQGKAFIYAHGGKTGVFTHHQEVVLEPWEGWA